MSNASQAWLRQDAMVGGDHKWLAGGDWTIEHYASLAKSVSAARISHAEGYATPLLDWTQVQRLDTAGAALLVEILGQTRYSTGRRQLQICPRIASP